MLLPQHTTNSLHLCGQEVMASVHVTRYYPSDLYLHQPHPHLLVSVVQELLKNNHSLHKKANIHTNNP